MCGSAGCTPQVVTGRECLIMFGYTRERRTVLRGRRLLLYTVRTDIAFGSCIGWQSLTAQRDGIEPRKLKPPASAWDGLRVP